MRCDEAEQEEIIEAWRGLAEIADNPKEKRNCLEQVLAYEPSDPAARRALAIINGKLNPADIIDPDHIKEPSELGIPTVAKSHRYICTHCGGKMSFAPEGSSLTCSYCGQRQSILPDMTQGAMLDEQDFTIALATAKGHSCPSSVRSIKCQGCGVVFMLAPEAISLKCPYYASAYVVEQNETHELILPEGVIPFSVTQDQATHA